MNIKKKYLHIKRKYLLNKKIIIYHLKLGQNLGNYQKIQCEGSDEGFENHP